MSNAETVFHETMYADRLFGLRTFDIPSTFVIWHSGLTSRVKLNLRY